MKWKMQPQGCSEEGKVLYTWERHERPLGEGLNTALGKIWPLNMALGFGYMETREWHFTQRNGHEGDLGNMDTELGVAQRGQSRREGDV